MDTAKSLVPESSTSEFELDILSLTKYKSPGTDQIPAELIQEVGNTLRSDFHKVISSALLYLFIKRMIKLTVVIIEG